MNSAFYSMALQSQINIPCIRQCDVVLKYIEKHTFIQTLRLIMLIQLHAYTYAYKLKK